MLDPLPGPVSLAEYLAVDIVSPERLEYRNGYIVAQAVGSGKHERIKNNLVEILQPGARAASCELLSGGVKVICPGGDRTIPDLGITCDERDRAALESAGEALIEHPWLLIEILSPTTASDDRGEKFEAYRAIPELTHYVLIDSRKQSLMAYVRGEDGRFVVDGPLQSLRLGTLGELTLETVYRDTGVPRIASPRAL